LDDADRQWFKSRHGFDACSSSRELSFCSHALHQDCLFIVPDARNDPRFADYASVTGKPWIRFYAGAPLVTADG
jgi:GAF domain-containing protein